MFGIFPEFWGLLQDAGRFYRNWRSKSKTPAGSHFGRHGTLDGPRVTENHCLAERYDLAGILSEHVSGKGRATIMSAPSESFMNPSCMAYKPIEDRVDRRQKLKLTGAQNTQQKNPAIGLYSAMKPFRQTQGLFALFGGCPSHASWNFCAYLAHHVLDAVLGVRL